MSAKPHRFAGNSEASRAAQLGNLKPMNALKSGAYSPGKLKPVREAILSELLVSFPNVRRDRLELLAQKRARIALLSDYIDEVGVLAHRKRGTTYPAVGTLVREEQAYFAELSKVEELSRQRQPFDALAELANDDEQEARNGG